MLMNLETLDWDDELLGFFDIPRAMLPQIRPSSDPNGYGEVAAPAGFAGIPLTGILGDQQAAMFGQVCFALGEAKNTYGTGNFMLLNTGTDLVRSKNGLLRTGCSALSATRWARTSRSTPWRVLSRSPVRRCSGCATSWASFRGASEIEALAASVKDNGGMYFVPAFSGLFAPYWRSDTRGAIVGLSRFDANAHLARATLESICYQSRDVSEAMEADSGVHLEVLKVDGGVTVNNLCM
jgi:glycerol kinase